MDEVKGDLVSAALGGTSVAHCVSADFRITGGVAKQLDLKFNIKSDLMTDVASEMRRVGNVIELKRRVSAKDGAVIVSIYNVITKATVRDKPTYDDFEAAIETLRDAVSDSRLRKSAIAIPRLGCGIDGLEWSRVKEILLRVFAKSDILLVVYTL